ncbi:MAG: bifunctional nuclease family protein [Candidatus Marinimicrobia bacterium]|nr:bifunctional nuclease family protein [Candidatus Neomarinimicrobiota bacterium]
MIEVIVKNILFFAQAAAPGYTLFLQMKDDDERSLPIVVGQFEAQAIALALEQINLDRPMTHDLLSQVITNMTDGLESVAIQKLKEGTFYAELNVRNAQGIEKIDARPSDAIALALRARVPIKVSKEVFDEASIAMPLSAELTEKSEPSLAENVSEITHRAELQFDLERDLREAISKEDYEKAALIRDRLSALSISGLHS